jgi:hypothetical protein
MASPPRKIGRKFRGSRWAAAKRSDVPRSVSPEVCTRRRHRRMPPRKNISSTTGPKIPAAATSATFWWSAGAVSNQRRFSISASE